MNPLDRLTLQNVSSCPSDYFSEIKNGMGVTEFIFEIYATKDKIKDVFTGLPRCQGGVLCHNNDCILFSNNPCFIWFHNIANT